MFRGLPLEDLSGVTFGGTDLTGARLDIVDTFPDLGVLNYQTIEIAISLSVEGPVEVRFNSESICPDGQPPEGLPRSCVREG